MNPLDVAATRDRVSAWISASGRPKAAIAAMANVDEKTVRQATAGDWNPTVNTLAKLAAIIPADWSPSEANPTRPKRRRPADDRRAA